RREGGLRPTDNDRGDLMTSTKPSAPARSNSGLQAYRAQLLYFRDTPKAEDEACEWIRDGLLVVRGGRIEQCGDHDRLIGDLPPGTPVHDWSGRLITPGFIDTHIHYPQTDMIASPAPGLLPWLETYTFPTERRFENPDYARDVARFFLDELL